MANNILAQHEGQVSFDGQRTIVILNQQQCEIIALALNEVNPDKFSPTQRVMLDTMGAVFASVAMAAAWGLSACPTISLRTAEVVNLKNL